VRRALLAALAALALAACGASGTGSGVGAIEPRDGKSGLQLSGTIDGRQFVVNDGAPVLRLGDCDVNDGADRDLCFFSRELDGGFVGLVVENPEVIKPATLPVVDAPCTSPRCDDVTGGIVVELQFAPGAPRTRATGGNVVFTGVDDGDRYSGRLNLTFPDGRISGSFEVVPRPEP
jgi:hypothetical protein